MTKIYEAKNHILIHTGYPDPIEHCHKASHIIISAKGNIKITADKKNYICQGIIIPSGISHKADTYGKDALVFLYDCTTEISGQIKTIRCIPDSVCDEIYNQYIDLMKNLSSENYYRFENHVLKTVGIKDHSSIITDDRILSSMQYIRSNLNKKITCRDAADSVYLSQSRFSHLFRNQIGMTFSAYVIYQRIMYVYCQIFKGKSITESSLEAGFSTSSHFADVNRRLFGLSASSITQNTSFTKIQ